MNCVVPNSVGGRPHLKAGRTQEIRKEKWLCRHASAFCKWRSCWWLKDMGVEDPGVHI